jgi:DNA-directed RNA polymerase specialized sigma24 family protein
LKKEIIDGYEVYSENGIFKELIYEDYLGHKVKVEFDDNLRKEFLQRKKEMYADDYRDRRYIDSFIEDGYMLEVKTSNIVTIPEEKLILDELNTKVIREIWKLPSPQNRRVYMFLVDGFSITQIAKIEKRYKSSVSESIEFGLKKLRKKIKKF